MVRVGTDGWDRVHTLAKPCPVSGTLHPPRYVEAGLLVFHMMPVHIPVAVVVVCVPGLGLVLQEIQMQMGAGDEAGPMVFCACS